MQKKLGPGHQLAAELDQGAEHLSHAAGVARVSCLPRSRLCASTSDLGGEETVDYGSEINFSE